MNFKLNKIIKKNEESSDETKITFVYKFEDLDGQDIKLSLLSSLELDYLISDEFELRAIKKQEKL